MLPSGDLGKADPGRGKKRRLCVLRRDKVQKGKFGSF